MAASTAILRECSPSFLVERHASTVMSAESAESVPSSTMTVCVPTVVNLTPPANVVVPPPSVESAGTDAPVAVSLEVKCTVPA